MWFWNASHLLCSSLNQCSATGNQVRMLLWSLLLDLITAVTHGSKSEQTQHAVYSFEEQPSILPSTTLCKPMKAFLKTSWLKINAQVQVGEQSPAQPGTHTIEHPLLGDDLKVHRSVNFHHPDSSCTLNVFKNDFSSVWWQPGTRMGLLMGCIKHSIMRWRREGIALLCSGVGST